jgi:hypothetical protein
MDHTRQHDADDAIANSDADTTHCCEGDIVAE